MKKLREFIIEYEFTSTIANGPNRFRYLTIKANNAAQAILNAKLYGFREFGAMFNDN